MNYSNIYGIITSFIFKNLGFHVHLIFYIQNIWHVDVKQFQIIFVKIFANPNSFTPKRGPFKTSELSIEKITSIEVVALSRVSDVKHETYYVKVWPKKANYERRFFGAMYTPRETKQSNRYNKTQTEHAFACFVLGVERLLSLSAFIPQKRRRFITAFYTLSLGEANPRQSSPRPY